ncbi:type III PLP-dependent enzyme [Luedemannella flava]|uniref:Type III PLP-dependent enzyme n=1 Tax=Luedemannella flava TaxID=349316 RepID=A0ABP4YV39_9ACTN
MTGPGVDVFGHVPQRVRAALLGLTPPRCAYVYDTTAAVSAARAVKAALPPAGRLLYAVKANGHPALLAALVDEVDGFEVASGGELDLVADVTGAAVAFSGPAKTDAELLAAATAGVTVHVESLHELRRLAAVASLAGPDGVRVALRVNRPGAVPDGSHQMTGVATPFGLDEADVPDAVALALATPGLRLVGFHLHAVSNSLDAVAHGRFAADAVAWSVRAAHRHGVDLTYVNLGGGLGVDYTGTSRLDLAVLAHGLTTATAALPYGASLVMEPGRFLAADAGWYAAEVVDVKATHGRWFAVVRGGTHHFRLPAAWGYSHPCQVVPVDDWPHPYPRPHCDEPVDVVGELCTPRDVLARDQALGRVRVGDLIVLGRAGAYGWDISHLQFLRHDPPNILVV